eukprot:TRINITY_DN6698_c0_g1_i2.p3 TRINITY_DN6698_c0_g1~~TRINITY_DN6698_c0_g1_i2.p3  ORF type:complete len:115 (-),score=25.30 TRINITY_DN6698_c0_g1_i2:348-692(-)
MGIAVPAIQQLTGINVIMFYAPTIFRSQGSSYMFLTFICMLVHLLATFASLFVTDKLGRRFLLLVGSAGCALGLLLATFLYPKPTMTATTESFLFDIAIYFFVGCFGLSHGPVE